MPLFEWSDDLSVNVRILDQQHKRLIAMINELHVAMRERSSNNVIEKILNDLKNYTIFHFKMEEKYFVEYDYPGSLSHKKEHEGFINKVTEFQEKYNNNKIGLSLEIMDFLKDWLQNHILDTDKKYTSFFNAKGLS